MKLFTLKQDGADKIGALGEKTGRSKKMFINIFLKAKFKVNEVLFYELLSHSQCRQRILLVLTDQA